MYVDSAMNAERESAKRILHTSQRFEYLNVSYRPPWVESVRITVEGSLL